MRIASTLSKRNTQYVCGILRARMRRFVVVLILALTASCGSPAPAFPARLATFTPPPTQLVPTERPPLEPTPLPTRSRWQFGELLPYAVQSGDTLRAIAAHF